MSHKHHAAANSYSEQCHVERGLSFAVAKLNHSRNIPSMFSRNLFTSKLVKRAIGMLIVLSVCALPLLRAQGPELPSAPVQEKVTNACTECHDSRIIMQQRLSKGAWTKEVDKMIKWGALVQPTDRDAIIDYLSTNFPTDKPADAEQRVASTKKP
jgi:hypothetical protein